MRISDAEGEAWGVVIGNPRADTIEVQLLEQGADRMYRIGAKSYYVLHESVVEHHDLYGDDNKVPRAFDALGFRMIDGGTFVKHSDEESGHLFPVGDGSFEVVSSDDDDDDAADPTLGGFIVDDDKCEPFTHAPETSDFVRETHAAVRAFNSWVPTDEQQAQARQFIIRQEERASRIDDELRFDKSMPPISYNRPTSGTHAK